MSGAETVSFDVGGKLYKVAKESIKSHKGSILARLVSETLKPETNKEDSQVSEIFIDRDGERFAYVLDFIRYGEVALPKGMSREMFIKDLDFFGIQLENEDKVKSNACDVSHADVIQIAVVQALFELCSELFSKISAKHLFRLA